MESNTTSTVLCEGEHHYLSTELEIAILRAFLQWTEGRIHATYRKIKNMSTNIPFLPYFLTTTENVATRIGVSQWFNALLQISDPWTTSIDSFVGKRLIDTIAFILKTSGHVHVVQSDGSTRVKPTIRELENELTRLQSTLDMEKQEKDELQATVHRVLAMVATENQSLHALLDHVQELELAAEANGTTSRIETLENELNDVRNQAALLTKENEQLRLDIKSNEKSNEPEEEMTNPLHDTIDSENERKSMDELERLQNLVVTMTKEKEFLTQQLIDIQSFRASTAGEQLDAMESQLADTNMKKTMLEAENKRLRVALKKSKKDQTILKRADTWNGVKA